MGRKRNTMSNAQALTLEDETFGERLHRAYRQGRALHGFTYRDISARLSKVYPVSMQTLQRLETQSDVPKQPRMRLVAYLALISYGFDPGAFGLDQNNVPLGFIDVEKTRAALDPTNGCYLASKQPYDPEVTCKSPGQRGTGSRAKRTTSRKVA